MASDLSKTSQVYHSITVHTRGVTAHIAGGSAVEISQHDDIVLDGSASNDPDMFDGTSLTTLFFSWSCSVQVGKVVYTCSDAHDKKELVFQNSANVTVPAGKLAPTSTNPYIFTVQVSKPGKMPASYSMRVTVRKEEIPTVAVRMLYGGQQQSDGSILVINVDERITMDGTCTAQNASLQWSFRPAIPTALLQDPSIFPLGTSSADLVILGAREAFVPGNIYSARLTCTTDRGISSSAQVTLDINAAPSGPGCQVCRMHRTLSSCDNIGSVTDQFHIQCDNFADKDTPLRFNFGYRVAGSSSPGVAWFGPTAANTFTTFLPSGIVNVYSYVQDAHGARSPVFETNVTVTLPSNDASAVGIPVSRRLLQGTTAGMAELLKAETSDALLKDDAREVNHLMSVAMTEIMNGQSGSYGALAALDASELQDFLQFAVKALTDASSVTVITTEYACESLGVAKLVAAASHVIAQDHTARGNNTKLAQAIVAASSFVTKVASSTGVLMDGRCSEDSLGAISMLLGAHKLQASYDSPQHVSALLTVCLPIHPTSACTRTYPWHVRVPINLCIWNPNPIVLHACALNCMLRMDVINDIKLSLHTRGCSTQNGHT
jgi:hypothetical protein